MYSRREKQQENDKKDKLSSQVPDQEASLDPSLESGIVY